MKRKYWLLAVMLSAFLILCGCSKFYGEIKDYPQTNEEKPATFAESTTESASSIEEYLGEAEADFLASEEVPVSLTYVYMGIEVREYEVSDEEVIEAVKKAIYNIKIEGPADSIADDAYQFFEFVDKEGNIYSFSFNEENYECSDGLSYTVSNAGALWNIADEIRNAE